MPYMQYVVSIPQSLEDVMPTKLYKNVAFCSKRCTMLLNLPFAARRLFTEKGVEILFLKDLERDKLVRKINIEIKNIHISPENVYHIKSLLENELYVILV